MPRKSSEPPARTETPDRSEGERPKPDVPQKDEPEPPARGRAAPAPRARSRKRLVWLTVGLTTLAGAIWSTIATSMVENTQSYLAEQLDAIQGGDVIRGLREQLSRQELAHGSMLARVQNDFAAERATLQEEFAAERATLQAEKEKILADGAVVTTAYVNFAFRSRQYCFDAVRAWAREKGFPEVEPSYPTHFIVNVIYSGVRLHLRCVGGEYSDKTFLLVAAPLTADPQLNSAHRALSDHFVMLDRYPEAVQPADLGWVNIGPFFEVGFVELELSYADLRAWYRGAIPSAIVTALSLPGSNVSTYSANSYYFFTSRNPGSSITIRSPDFDVYSLYGPDQVWRPSAEVQAEGTEPDAALRVRVEVLVAIAGVNYGERGLSWLAGRYLGDEAKGLLARTPGIVDGGAMRPVLRSW
jgi:hypothetical protein